MKFVVFVYFLEALEYVDSTFNILQNTLKAQKTSNLSTL